MDTHYLIRRIAGSFVLLSLALGFWVSPYWYLLTAFVGLNLLQSSFTRWCPMERLLGTYPDLKAGDVPDARSRTGAFSFFRDCWKLVNSRASRRLSTTDGMS